MRTAPVRLGEKGTAALEFALLAPVLITLIFAVVVYSTYFSAYFGVRQAAAEAARAALAGLSTDERTALATERARQVLDQYGLPSVGADAAQIAAVPEGGGSFKVEISYDIAESPIMRYGTLLPLPARTITSKVTVTNGGYS